MQPQPPGRGALLRRALPWLAVVTLCACPPRDKPKPGSASGASRTGSGSGTTHGTREADAGGSKASADAHLSSAAKVQKKIITDCLNGTRSSGKRDWKPRYMEFPMRSYTKRGGIDAMDRWQVIRKHFA